MAWPANFVDGETLTAVRLKQWTDAVQTWGGDISPGAGVANNPLSEVGMLSTPFTDVTLVNGANQNLDVGGKSCIRIVGPTAAFSIGGFINAVPGQWLHVYNSVLQTMTLNHLDPGTTANFRINSVLGGPISFRANGKSIANMRYFGSEAFWVLIGSL